MCIRDSVAGALATLAMDWPLRSGLFLAILAGALVATVMTRAPKPA